MNVKNVMCVKKIIYGLLLHAVVKMENIWQVLCIVHTTKKQNFLTNFNEKKATCKIQNLYFTCIFTDYYSIIDSC